MRNILHSLTITIILVGLLIGYAKADYSYDPLNLYNRYYYGWNKGIEVLMALCISFPSKQYKTVWLLVVCFFCLREVWEIYAIQDYATASRPSVIFTLFLVDIFVICGIILYPQLKRLKRVWITQLQNRKK